ncbi:MAG: amidinotransferase [Sulfobacillus acidophilus]|uniref:Amidinotransferase n=1 Tax=Sulfobacillus acidophilus TaxID=53633 RepID=A0A2T2WNW8_9FIRM|nr:MAG: amidinotransferase [Sulfobacillus acidophilus]
MTTAYGVQSMVDPLARVLLKSPQAAFRNQPYCDSEWVRYGYREAPLYNRAEQEFSRFVDILAQHVPSIEFLEELPETGLDSLYTHDAVKVTRDGAILLNPAKPLRKGEPEAVRQFLSTHNIPVVGSIQSPGHMEGGDVVWIDERTVALGRGYRTNDDGVTQFRQLVRHLVDEVVIVPLPHAEGPDHCLHLMSLISLVDRDLAVVYSRYLPVFFREWLMARGIELIEVSDAEYESLGTNVLALAPRQCLILTGNPQTKQALQSRGATVWDYEGLEISLKGTGGPTCLTAPLWRHN